MTVQPSTTREVPGTVKCEILGKPFIADVVRTEPKADLSAGIRDVLVVDVMGSRFRVDAADVDPVGGGA